MKRMALATLVAVMSTAARALAVEPGFCTSMCAAEQRACRAAAQALPLAERLAAGTVESRNPLARTAQGAVPGQASRALDAAGDDGRRMARLGACDGAGQRCTRSCAVQADGEGRAAPRRGVAPAAAPQAR